MLLADGRVYLNPAPPPARTPALPVALLGHVPGRARVQRLTRAMREQWRGLGLSASRTRIERLAGGGAAVDDEDARLAELLHLPLALDSYAQFLDLFPDARSAAALTQHTPLAGSACWLPLAVEDFFAAGGERLWLVRVPESEGRDGLLPAGEPDFSHPETLRGIDVALGIPEIGLLALPDLERLQVPPQIRADAVAVQRPLQARFVPLGQLGPREQNVQAADSVPATPPWPFTELLARLLPRCARWRPDVQCLLTLPLAADPAHGAQADADALARLAALDGEALRQAQRLQLLFPYLCGPRAPLASAGGLLAGHIAARAVDGAWRSIAGRALASDALPWPLLERRQAAALRETPGIGVLINRDGALQLDDERLCGGLPGTLAEQPGQAAANSGTYYYRSAEVVRLIGWLLRQLAAFGERLVFVTDPDDPRPGLLLEDFFRRLHARGGLRGARFEDACRIRRVEAGAATIAWDIEIAPAVPIDTLTLSLLHTDGAWRAQVDHG